MEGSPYFLETIYFLNLAQSGFLKYVDMPLQANRDKPYEVFLIYCQDKTIRYTGTQTDRQTDKQTDRQTDRQKQDKYTLDPGKSTVQKFI